MHRELGLSNVKAAPVQECGILTKGQGGKHQHQRAEVAPVPIELLGCGKGQLCKAGAKDSAQWLLVMGSATDGSLFKNAVFVVIPNCTHLTVAAHTTVTPLFNVAPSLTSTRKKAPANSAQAWSPRLRSSSHW